MSGATTRAEIIEAADRLFYERGYEHTSFATIGDVVSISRGNFYYHFRAKDDILSAVIDARLAATREMLERWESEDDRPAGRIRKFIHILVANRVDIQSYGCPVGTLTSELAKLDHPRLPEASGLFSLFRTWLRDQFALLGHEAEADDLAMHLLAMSQGVATLASAFRDEEFLRREVERMCEWLGSYTEGDHRGQSDVRVTTDERLSC